MKDKLLIFIFCYSFIVIAFSLYKDKEFKEFEEQALKRPGIVVSCEEPAYVNVTYLFCIDGILVKNVERLSKNDSRRISDWHIGRVYQVYCPREDWSKAEIRISEPILHPDTTEIQCILDYMKADSVSRGQPEK